jgi:hypothetical protein
MKTQASLVRSALLLIFISLAAVTALSQTNAIPARVSQPVDIHNLVSLPGNIHPLARPEFDGGAAPDDLPMERMLLVLKRSDAQEAALRQLLDDQQVKSSGRFHHWMTPAQFGQQFGPADSDIQAVTGWLSSQGFQVAKVAAGRTVIEFSGSAGLVRQALGAEIHRFHVNGSDYWANTSNPQIPAALKPVVSGFASFNNFPRHSSYHIVDTFQKSAKTGAIQPLFTVPTSSTANVYAVAPYDFATIYNVLPLWNAGIDGTGQTIAIVGETNIVTLDPISFRETFGLSFTSPNVIVNGPDPGIVPGDETEALIDVEWSGAVAKGATIDLVVSQTTEATLGIDLSALYIVDNDLAPVESESYGDCEQDLGAGGNAFQYAIREQGAAEGITMINSSGDGGSARCDQGQPEYAASAGLAVSGLASTPFNVAVGGTDFGDNNNWTPYWNTTNGANYASAKSYIPETTWNATCAASGQAGNCANAASATPEGIDLVAGGGGPSTCGLWTGTGLSAACASGYPKPAWQTGSGVPNDGVRDIPDVSLFASTGTNGSFYALCEQDAVQGISCSPGSDWYFIGVGGTSVAAPDFAGIMALVNQKTGERQGNANYTLYPLAAASGSQCTSNTSAITNSNCIFYDVVTGNNSVACVGGSKYCSNSSPTGFGILESGGTPAWSTTAGYDLATGLGSLNAANLVNKWTTVNFLPTTTAVSALPGTVAHGQSVSFTINVTSASGTPSGDVSLLAQGSSVTPTPIGTFTLGSGGTFSGSATGFPGGSYSVYAHYAGDGTHGASDSAPQEVNGQKGSSQVLVSMLSCSYTSGACTPGATSFVYGASLEVLRMDVTDSSGTLCISPSTGLPVYLCPTGTVNPTVNSAAIANANTPPNYNVSSYLLNSQGYTEDQYIELPGGTDAVGGAYSGDLNYNAGSTTSNFVATVTPAASTITLTTPAGTVNEGFTLNASITTQSRGLGPTGNVQFFSDGTPFGQPQPVDGSGYEPSTLTYASATAYLLNTTAPVGTHSITAQYSGDGNYAGATSAPINLTVTDFSLAGNPPSITVSTAAPTATTPVVVTPLGGFAGTVLLQVATSPAGMTCKLTPQFATFTTSTPQTLAFSCTLTAAVTSHAAPRFPSTPAGRSRPIGGWRQYLALEFLLLTLALVSALTKRREGCIAATVLFIAAVWVGCGGGAGGTSPGGGGTNPSGTPMVGLSATGLTFSQQPANTPAPSQVVTVSNTGTGTLNLTQIALSGPNFSDFSQSNNCGQVAANSSCQVTVGFTPGGPGTRTGTISLQDNASGSPQTVSLTGTGASGPLVSLSPASLSFGLVAVGASGTPQTVTLTNNGDAPLIYPDVQFTTNSYTQTNSCPNSLAAGSSCSISATFAPTGTGSQNAQLMVYYSGYGNPQAINVSGTGGLAPGSGYSATISGTVSGNGFAHNLPIAITVQ